MLWPLHSHYHRGCVQRNTDTANSVEHVHVQSKIQYNIISITDKYIYFVMFCGPCFKIYQYNKNQQDALFTFSFIPINNL